MEKYINNIKLPQLFHLINKQFYNLTQTVRQAGSQLVYATMQQVDEMIVFMMKKKIFTRNKCKYFVNYRIKLMLVFMEKNLQQKFAFIIINLQMYFKQKNFY